MRTTKNAEQLILLEITRAEQRALERLMRTICDIIPESDFLKLYDPCWGKNGVFDSGYDYRRTRAHKLLEQLKK